MKAIVNPLVWVIASLLVVFSIGTAAAPAHAEASTFTQVETLPADTLLPPANPCTGLTLTYTGNVHTVFHITLDDSGGFHLHTHTNSQDVTATDSLGNVYRLNYTTHSNTNGQVGSEETTITNLHLEGDNGSFDLQTRFHVTVNANGEVTSSYSDFDFNCQ